MKGEITMQKTERCIIAEMEHITADYFCDHIEEIIELANAENRCYVLVDEDNKEEVILVPVTVYEELCTTAGHTAFQEQMEQHYGKPMSEIKQDNSWESCEE